MRAPIVERGQLVKRNWLRETKVAVASSLGRVAASLTPRQGRTGTSR